MKATKLVIVILSMLLFYCMVASVVSAQPVPFDGNWWKGKVSFKGSRITQDPSNMLSNTGSGSAKVWFYTKYFASPARYEIFTCGQSPFDQTDFGIGQTTMNFTDIYLSNQLNQLWNLDNGTGWDIDTTVGMPFNALSYNINTNPVIFIKGKSLSQASLSTVSCTAYVVDASNEDYSWILGTCSVKAKTVDSDKVSSDVPQTCIDQLAFWTP
jgi:hypothetical protein